MARRASGTWLKTKKDGTRVRIFDPYDLRPLARQTWFARKFYYLGGMRFEAWESVYIFRVENDHRVHGSRMIYFIHSDGSPREVNWTSSTDEWRRMFYSPDDERCIELSTWKNFP